MKNFENVYQEHLIEVREKVVEEKLKNCHTYQERTLAVNNFSENLRLAKLILNWEAQAYIAGFHESELRKNQDCEVGLRKNGYISEDVSMCDFYGHDIIPKQIATGDFHGEVCRYCGENIEGNKPISTISVEELKHLVVLKNIKGGNTKKVLDLIFKAYGIRKLVDLHWAKYEEFYNLIEAL